MLKENHIENHMYIEETEIELLELFILKLILIHRFAIEDIIPGFSM